MTKVEMDRYIAANLQVARALYGEDLRFRTEQPPPQRENFNKVDYLREWLAFFDDELIWAGYLEHYHALWHPYTSRQLEFAFGWVQEHFLELCLGGNMAWLTAAESLMEHVRHRSPLAIGSHFERKLKVSFIPETLWADDVYALLSGQVRQ